MALKPPTIGDVRNTPPRSAPSPEVGSFPPGPNSSPPTSTPEDGLRTTTPEQGKPTSTRKPGQ